MVLSRRCASLPVTAAEVEQTFSHSRTMFPDRLNRLAMLPVQLQLAQKLDFRDTINDFLNCSGFFFSCR